MKDRLQLLGWSEIEAVDEDLGRSACGQVARSGFERLVAEVSLGRVGAVAARELSRLARNSRDWQQLIEVCRIVDTLLIDQDTVYDARRSNDRLLLGLKGSMNEYELDLLRQRALEAREEKASRGELLVAPAVGFVRGQNRYEKDPDQRVQQAIGQLFAKFLEMGSLRQVLFWMIEHELQMPVRRMRSGVWRTEWRRPDYGTLYRILTGPIYAGAYVYGQKQTEIVWEGNGSRKRTISKGYADARVLLKDQHEGYICWEEFERIQQMLTDNSSQFKERESRGAARAGSALLAGLLRCGRCGKKLLVRYTGREAGSLRFGEHVGCRRQCDDLVTAHRIALIINIKRAAIVAHQRQQPLVAKAQQIGWSDGAHRIAETRERPLEASDQRRPLRRWIAQNTGSESANRSRDPADRATAAQQLRVRGCGKPGREGQEKEPGGAHWISFRHGNG